MLHDWDYNFEPILVNNLQMVTNKNTNRHDFGGYLMTRVLSFIFQALNLILTLQEDTHFHFYISINSSTGHI